MMAMKSNKGSNGNMELGQEAAVSAAGDAPTTTPNSVDDGKRPAPLRSVSVGTYVLLVAFVISCYVGMIAQYSIWGQYIVHRYAVEYGVEKKGHHGSSLCNPAANGSTVANKTATMMMKKAQEEAAKFNIWSQLCSGLPSIFSVALIGAYSDKIGRKITIIVPWVGFVIFGILQLLTVAYTWPMWVYLLANVISGLTGNYAAILTGVFAFVADTTTKEQRSKGIVIVETCFGVANTVSHLSIGFLIKSIGYLIPDIIFAVMCMSSGLFVFCLPETSPVALIRANKRKPTASDHVLEQQQQPPDSHTSLVGNRVDTGLIPLLKDYVRVLSRTKRRTGCLCLLLFTFFCQVCCFFGNMPVFTVYAYGQPFCWTSVELGIYNGVQAFLKEAGSLFGILLLRRWLPDHALMAISLASYMVNRLVVGLASEVGAGRRQLASGLLYSSCITVFASLMVPLLRSSGSQLMSSTEQGVVFSLYSNVETLGSLIGGSTWSAIFHATLSFHPGAVFYVSTAVMLLAALSYGAFHYYRNKFENATVMIRAD